MEFTIDFIQLFIFGIKLALPLLVILVFLIVGLGQIVGRIEQWSIFDSFYWSVITSSTVGYGDIKPTQKVTKLLTIFVVTFGFIFSGLIVAIAFFSAKEVIVTHYDLEILQKTIESLAQ